MNIQADYMAALAAFDNVTAESLAAQAGLLDEGNDAGTFNSVVLARQMGILQSKPLAEQMKVHHEFAAKYLPAAADKYRQSSGPLNSCLSLMNMVGHTPYFVRFSKTPSGQGIAALQVKRMAVADVSSDTLDASSVGEICQFLSTVLVLQGFSDVDDNDKNTLVSKLRKWKRLYSGVFAGETSDRCLGLITDEASSRVMIQAVKRSLERSLEECGAPGCLLRQQTNGSRLMLCSKCKTALYCGPEHQKQTWKTHKAICFAAAF